MQKVVLLLIILSALLYGSCNNKRDGNPRVLVFSKTDGFYHASIPKGIATIQQLGRENGFEVDTTTNAEWFQQDSLAKYAAVIFLNTTENVLDYRQEAAFERYVQAGGGFVGVHSATDTEYDWGWYGRLVGGYFNGHPPGLQKATFYIKDRDFSATEHFPDTVWQVEDELYNFKNLNPDVNVLMTVDESTYEGGTNGDYHPMSWYHEYDGGRAFYTALGHSEEIYDDELYQKHLLGGIQFVIGDNNELDHERASTQLPPDEDRFSKTQLAEGGFFEPTELTVLPNLDILIVQRRGEILKYDNEAGDIKQVGFLDVYFKTNTPGVNAEEGLMGLAKDPDYANNRWVYMYYSPIDSSVNRLSRFTFENDTIDLATEKVILEVKSQREICCHTGGSIAFGPDGLLYLSTGDNATPFDEKDAPYVNHGFAPLNDLPGRQQYDARRSAGNTNDLRGKILRIRVKDDATYEIPEGNLFAPGTDKTRPEIYVMGNRNPYRISVDPKNSTLYWGEVGPDANADSMGTRGPRGYDEMNRAARAGFYGWPLFVGNNYAYRDYDYATGQSGAAFDPAKPINDSRNNTGLRELPPAQPAMIWYPYDEYTAFPQVGTGGRNAMAGPVYYPDMFPEETRLPEYYNEKLLVYDWMRGWIKAVSFFEDGTMRKIEPFFPDLKVNALIDMEVGPDGRLYLLEYGSGWFSANEDSGLARIDFNGGNRPPKVLAFETDKTTGTLPLKVTLTAEAEDPEQDGITYEWNLGDGNWKTTDTPRLEHTYTAAGDYAVSVEVKDAQGATVKSNPIYLYAGNEVPRVEIELTGGNKTFYLPGQPLRYSVSVQDPNDTARFDPTNLFVSVDYVEGYDQAGAEMGHQEGEALISGKSLALSLDCKSCHKEAEASIGPSYVDIAKRYAKDQRAVSYLTDKVIKGSSGVWGANAMPAHPTLAESEVRQISTWIMSLGGNAAREKSLPPAGTITPPTAQQASAMLVLSASYTDKGGPNIKPLTGKNSVALKSNQVGFTGQEKTQGFSPMSYGGQRLLIYPQAAGWFALDSIDLTGVRSLDVISGWQEAPKTGWSYEVRLDGPDGQVLGTGTLAKPTPGTQFGLTRVALKPVTDGRFHDLYFVYKPQVTGGEPVQAGVAGVQFNAR